ncbi:MAG: hypothetical protein ACPG61_07295 [Paracoccaceae bacterium]
MIWNSTAQTLLADRSKGMAIRWLLWVEARDRTTGDPEPLGLWSGEDHAEFDIGGDTRTYFGALDGLQCDDIQYQAGTVIQSMGMRVPMDLPETIQLFRVSETRLAPCEVHWALFDTINNTLADVTRVFKGRIDGAPITTPGDGKRAMASIMIASSLRGGTKMAGARKSNSMQLLRGSGDIGRRYGDLGRVANDEWK